MMTCYRNVKDTKSESKSQLSLAAQTSRIPVTVMSKIQNLKANHN